MREVLARGSGNGLGARYRPAAPRPSVSSGFRYPRKTGFHPFDQLGRCQRCHSPDDPHIVKSTRSWASESRRASCARPGIAVTTNVAVEITDFGGWAHFVTAGTGSVTANGLEITNDYESIVIPMKTGLRTIRSWAHPRECKSPAWIRP